MFMKRLIKYGLGILLGILLAMLPAVFAPTDAGAAATTSLTIKKLASDGTTVLAERTVTYQWLVDPVNIPVMGDGTTHYYHQGPVFKDDPDEVTEQALRWNPEENTNVQEKDMGALQGTNIKDLCDLVGGMAEGDTIQIKAIDGFKKTFAYKNVYEYSSREGPMVICWYNDGKYPDTGYTEGMRLAWFADTSTNPWGIHAFGNWDWHEAADETYWYYYMNGGERYPTTTGLSVQYVSELIIYSNEPVPVAPVAAFTADTTSGTAPLTVQFTDQSTNSPTSWAWDFDNDGTVDSTNQNPTHEYSAAGAYSVKLTVTNAAGSDEELKTSYIKAVVYADFPIQLIGTSTVNMSKADMEALLNTANTYTDGNGNIFEGVPLQQLVAKVDDSDPATLNTSLLGAYNIVFTGLNQDGTDYVKTATAGSWSSYFTGGSIQTNDVFIATKVKIGGTGDFVDLPEVSVNNSTKSWRPGIVNGSNIVGSGNRVGGLYKIQLTGIAPVAPAAAFTADTTSGTAPLTVQFTDQSTNSPTSWAWDFNNDGTVDSTDQNPTHEYSTAGAYSVKLTATNDAGSDDEIKTDYITVNPAQPTMDVLYDGTVNLTPGETFDVTAYNSGTGYTVSETTPLGALQTAATVAGFTYGVTDKNYGTSGALLLDNVGTYLRDKTNGAYWYAYVNDVYKDGYNNAPGALNLIELVNGDRVEFYYAAGIADPADLNAVKAAATAAVKTVASTGVAPTDWTLQLSGAKNASVTKAYFENGLACSSSGHQVFWTDDDSNVWGGVPLWLLVAMVDDDPDVGPDHFNFNDDLAAQNYEVNVIAGDEWTATLDSAAIARSDGYIVANTLNGEPLPLQTEGGKDCWPLYLKGSAVFGGQQVGNIVRIELSGLPQPTEGWTLEMIGEVGDTITQEEFEEGLACTGSGHYKEWTDIEGNVWSGVPLWVLLGVVDDIETGSHWTFNDTLAAGYSVNVVAGDGFSKNFAGADVAGSDGYIIANECNGAPLTDAAPLRLVGAGVVKDDGSLGGRAVGSIAKIEIPELQTPAAAPESWNITLNGKISDVIAQAEFEAGLACPSSGHLVEWTDIDGNVWSGIPLWFLTGWVDDRQPHDYNANQAMAGYTVLVKAGDGYTKDFASTDVAWSNNYIIANKINGVPLTDTSWPLRLVGAGVASAEGALSGTSVRNIAEIELTGFQTALPIPEVHIIKYAEDRTTIIDEMTVDYQWMQSNLDVIGDGTTVYRYEGITNNPDDVWDAAETYPGGYKIENAVKGTRVKDLCDLVGGMGAGTEIVLVASDDYETVLPYSSIYTDPAVQARQGDAILAWWADGAYVPNYKDGMRLFFTPGGDNVYGQWDMHETLPSNYWHYYYSNNVQYPSCAGLSSKLITTIEIYSVPVGDWTLELNGQDIGGIQYDVSKTYFEQALACQFGANHKATYTDSQERVWEGMPLWFLAGFVDDADQHSNNSFNDALALAGYQVVITAADGYSVTIDSADIVRNSDYIVANSLNGQTIPDTDDNWPLRLVGLAVTGATSISQIASIELVSSAPVDPPHPVYTVSPGADTAYTAGTTQDGINTMTVKAGVTGFKYFTVSITPVIAHSGNETVVFAHFRNGSQLGLNATRADFDQVSIAQAGFNVQPGDVIKAYIVDDLTNAIDFNPTILQ